MSAARGFGPITILGAAAVLGSAAAASELRQYHQPSDRLDGSWSFEGMIQDAQLGMPSAWLIAQVDALPTWTRGDEFEAVRPQALAALDEK